MGYSNSEACTALDSATDGHRKPRVVYFCPDANHDVTLPVSIGCEWTNVHAWGELAAQLEVLPDLVVVHTSMLRRNGTSASDFVQSIVTMCRCQNNLNNCSDLRIAVCIDEDCNPSLIKELKKTRVAGIIPSARAFGMHRLIEALAALLTQSVYWPMDIIHQLIRLPLEHSVSGLTTTGVHLTNRQQQVLGLICKRGLSNKTIAHTLNIAESTVKIHVSAIMKAYCVQNRTQLVLASGTGLKV